MAESGDVLARGGGKRIGRIFLQEESEFQSRDGVVVERHGGDGSNEVRVSHASMRQFVDPFHGTNSFLILMIAVFRVRQGSQDACVHRTEGRGFLQVCFGRNVIVFRQSQPAHVHVGGGELDVELHCGLEFRLCANDIVRIEVRQPKIIMGGNKIRIVRDGLLQMRDGLLRVLAAQQ